MFGLQRKSKENSNHCFPAKTRTRPKEIKNVHTLNDKALDCIPEEFVNPELDPCKIGMVSCN